MRFRWEYLTFTVAAMVLVEFAPKSQGQYSSYLPPSRSVSHPTSVPPKEVQAQDQVAESRPPNRILTGDPGCYREEGFYSNTDDCTKFYRCVFQGSYYRRFDFDCAPGTVYDPSLSVCNFQNQVPECGGEAIRRPVVIWVRPARPVPPTAAPRPPARRPDPILVVHQTVQDNNEEDRETLHYVPQDQAGNYGQRDPNYFGGSRERPSSGVRIPDNNYQVTIHRFVPGK